MVKSSYAKGGAVALTVLCAVYGCRSGEKGNVSPRLSGQRNPTVSDVPQKPNEAASGSLLTDEPAAMAEEDQQRAEQSPHQQPQVRPRRPERPLRPVTR